MTLFENLKHIKNPLTLISLFAGVAEVSGAGILPFIDTPENQRFYIYFLMGFPTLTVVLFFITLNFNHRTLYAPSDYKDEQNFVNPFGTATSGEVDRKLQQETSEVQGNVEDTGAPPPEPQTSTASDIDDHGVGYVELTDRKNSTNGSSHTPSESSSPDIKNKTLPPLTSLDRRTADLMEPYELQHRELMADVALSEKLAIRKLATWLDLDFKQDVTFSPHNSSRRYVFDAAAYSKERIDIVEVKLFTNSFSANRFLKTFEQTDSLSRTFTDKSKFTLHLVVVMEKLFVSPAFIKKSIEDAASEYNFRVKVHVTTKDVLDDDSIGFL